VFARHSPPAETSARSANAAGAASRGAPPLRGTVLFVHGLWLTGAESFLLKRRLAAQGWALRVFRYSSLAESMDRVARRCARYALTVASRTQQPVHLLGHSLGGLVIYRMLETGLLEPDRFSGDFCRVVFMGTPARGSQSARALLEHGAAGRLLGAAGAQDLIEGVSQRWPFPAQLGIIAGTAAYGLGRLLTRLDGPNDGTVCVAETCLEGATDCCELPVTHTTMCFSPQVAVQIAEFLQSGHFSVAAPDDLQP
jgi:pimeloyl-ACP methyl ester carboxylesterase